MYLKCLELQGFKSFPDKTKLNFEQGATVIVGPNGSGKSNISDAMRWVLGEISSKNLRGSKMEDIIFGGADSRKPMGFAEVSVTFDNTDSENKLECPYDEVTVTRRYYRSGESEYYINRSAVRLKDIYELFLNTGIGREGYSIIGQGKIAEIISRKSEDRRNIFEDASGIAKFRHKKTESERKLASTEENMTRVNDIFIEISAQVGPLEKEAEKAKRAIELLENKKKADVQLWLFDTEKYRNDISKAEALYKQSAFELTAAEDAIATYEKQRDHLTEISQSNRYESEKLLTQIREQIDENHKTESELKVSENEVLHIKMLSDSAEEAKKDIYASIENENEAINKRLEKIAEIRLQADETKKRYDDTVKRADEISSEIERLENDIAASLDDIHSLEAERTQLQVRLSVIENAKNADKDRDINISDELESYKKTAEALFAESEEVRKAIGSYQKDMDGSDERINELSRLVGERSAERDDAEKNASDCRLKLASLDQRIDTYRTMDERLEGYNNSVRFVMKAYSEGRITDRNGERCGKIYGPVSKLISVDEKYVTAVEISLGASLQNIVVEDEDTAKCAMFALKKNEAGRATFLPLTSVKASNQTPEIKEAAGFTGFIAYADELVTSDTKLSGIVSNMLGRVTVFDNIDNATKMAKAMKYRVRAVTLDGQQINVGGSFTGGSVRQGNSILGRSGEIKRLEEEKKGISAVLKKLTARIGSLSSELEKMSDEIASLESRKKMISLMQGAESSRLEQIKAKIEANDTLTQKLRADFEDLVRMRERYDEDFESLSKEAQLYDEKISALSAIRSDKDIEKNGLEDEKENLSSTLTELYIKTNELQKDIETEELLIKTSRDHIEDLKKDIGSQDEKIRLYGQNIKVLEDLHRENTEKLVSGEKELERLNESRAALEENSAEYERKISAVNAGIREKNAQKDIIFREHSNNENKLQNLKNDYDKLSAKLWDDHELTRSDAIALGYEEIDASMRPRVAQIQTECRNKLRAIGNVDLDAVNKYKEVKERYDYMDKQIKDLASSKSDLEKIIKQLDEEMKSAFIESFNKINENFNRVFTELFGGGSAELQLSDPDDVLNCGVEIKAAPPGKIIKNMMQLSGGEQAFVAIALLFAVLQVNPTPFCIFDEIEAALDEVNVSRFSEYIKRYSGDTQFILITHRRGTMEAANRLYGVTMPEHGISKVLALDVSEISKKKEGDWNGIF